jgi:hypothetical protein
MPEVLDLSIGPCPVGCGEDHDVQVTIVYEAGPAPLVFGGTANVVDRVIDVSCPLNGELFPVSVPLPAADRRSVRSIVGLVGSAAGEPARATSVDEDRTADWRDTEYQEWIRNSGGTGRDFCKAMVTATAGAVPVYFVLLKYLGFDHAMRGWLAIAVVPPVLFLAATIVFADALRPRGEHVDREAFVAYRQRRLRAMDVRIKVGMAMFSTAVAAASILALALIRL